VKEMCSLGARVLTCARNKDELEQAIEELKTLGRELTLNNLAPENRAYLSIFTRLRCKGHLCRC
jgi:NADP-dependent 3-hydroxy acid dehydrogenase YdfG